MQNMHASVHDVPCVAGPFLTIFCSSLHDIQIFSWIELLVVREFCRYFSVIIFAAGWILAIMYEQTFRVSVQVNDNNWECTKSSRAIWNFLCSSSIETSCNATCWFQPYQNTKAPQRSEYSQKISKCFRYCKGPPQHSVQLEACACLSDRQQPKFQSK